MVIYATGQNSLLVIHWPVTVCILIWVLVGTGHYEERRGKRDTREGDDYKIGMEPAEVCVCSGDNLRDGLIKFLISLQLINVSSDTNGILQSALLWHY